LPNPERIAHPDAMTSGLPLLNIITPVLRPQYLSAIYENLSGINEFDIKWFTIFGKRQPKPQ